MSLASQPASSSCIDSCCTELLCHGIRPGYCGTHSVWVAWVYQKRKGYDHWIKSTKKSCVQRETKLYRCMSREYKGQDRHMAMCTDGQMAYMNQNKNRTEVVTEHAHTERNTCNAQTRFVLQREIAGSRRFRGCLACSSHNKWLGIILHVLWVWGGLWVTFQGYMQVCMYICMCACVRM